MATSTYITATYNGQAPWGAYTPYVSMSFEPINFGGVWANVRTISLNGSVVGGSSYYLEIIKNNIISAFSVNGKTFTFVDSLGAGMSFNNVFVDSISFPAQQYFGKLDFSINLKAYSFTGLEVLEPTDQIEIETSPDKTITITHSVSAQGVDGSAIGLDNAKTFVTARTNIVPIAVTTFAIGMNYIIMDETESVNRLTSTYSKSKKYLVNRLSGSASTEEFIFKRYSVSISDSVEQEFKRVDIVAEYRGGKNTSSTNFSNSADLESALHSKASSVSGLTLNSVPENISIDIDENNKSLSIKASFDTNTCFGSAGWFFDYSLSSSTDFVLGVTKISIDGELMIKGGLERKKSIINDFINSTNINDFLYGFVSPFYSIANNSSPLQSFTLNPESENLTISKSISKGVLKLSASFNDENFIPKYSHADWSVSVDTSIPLVKTAASITENGHWSIQALNFYTREKISTSVNLSIREDSGYSPSAMSGLITNNAYAINNNLFSMAGGAYYIVSESKNIKEEDTTSIALSEERSYDPNFPIITGFNRLQ